MHKTIATIIIVILCICSPRLNAQELNAKVIINRSQVSNTKSEVFEALETAITQFLNERQWTQLQMSEKERIQCTFNITIDTYSETDNSFQGSLIVVSSRPVYGSGYTTTVFSTKDSEFNFTFSQFDQLEWRSEQVDNNLTAMLAYWAYSIIGYDLDTMAPMAGTDILHQAQDVCNNADGLGFSGWKAFGDTRNRYAIVNDYMDGAMEPYRQMQYDYYRKGLDQMSTDTDAARDTIAVALQQLQAAHEAKSLSLLPQIFTDFKRDELVSIFSGHGSREQREAVYDIVFRINPSQNNYWEKIKQ